MRNIRFFIIFRPIWLLDCSARGIKDAAKVYGAFTSFVGRKDSWGQKRAKIR